MMRRIVFFVACALALSAHAAGVVKAQVSDKPAQAAAAQNYPAPAQGDFVIRDFRFRSGEVLPELRLHYTTVGTPVKDKAGVVRNAVLIMHGTGGTGRAFLREQFAGVLFGPGQLLDATKFFIILPDGIGHGGSSKPSDGLHARFPRYGYRDMVEGERRVLESLGVRRLRLLGGTSVGCMHAGMWLEVPPELIDAAQPLACLPIQMPRPD